MRKYKLFISHAWHRDEEYWRVVKMLDNDPFFSWENLSIPEHSPVDASDGKPLAYHLRAPIRECCAFIACCGMWVPRSDWILLEVEFARRIGRPIIALPPHGQLQLPLAVSSCARRVVYQARSLTKAVRELALPEGV